MAAATRSVPAPQVPRARPEVLPDGKSHINRIFAKTGCADRAAAIRYALDQHLA